MRFALRGETLNLILRSYHSLLSTKLDIVSWLSHAEGDTSWALLKVTKHMLAIPNGVRLVVKVSRRYFVPGVIALDSSDLTPASLILHVNEAVVKRWFDLLSCC